MQHNIILSHLSNHFVGRNLGFKTISTGLVLSAELLGVVSSREFENMERLISNLAVERRCFVYNSHSFILLILVLQQQTDRQTQAKHNLLGGGNK